MAASSGRTYDPTLSGHITFNTNLYAAVHLADGFYLLENPSDAPRPVYRLSPGRIDRLSTEDATRAAGEDVLLASGDVSDLSQIDAISAKRGWRRLNEPGHGLYKVSSDPIDSTRHRVRLRHVGGWLDKMSRIESSPSRYPRPAVGSAR